MSLTHALLTSLLEKASSGFELARRFDKSIGYFWHATHQQIYRELARMEDAGWITSEAAPDGGKTRKRLYQVLPAGESELRRWVLEPSAPTDLRDELMVRLRADAAIGPLGLEPELRRRQALHESRLMAYRFIERRDFPQGSALSREARIQHLILKTGIMYEQAWATWSADALATLEECDDKPSEAVPAAPHQSAAQANRGATD
jgi:DNA-binding PadR family transcriptional regulator